MTDTGTILVATDFSECGGHASTRAAQIAEALDRELLLLHVLPSGALERLRSWLGDDIRSELALRRDAEERLRALSEQLNQQHGLRVRHEVHAGEVSKVVAELADASGAEFVVVGARGEGVLRRFLIGTTAERLLQRTPKPLLVVRRPSDAAYRKALVAIDCSHGVSPALESARRVAAGAHFVLLSSVELPFEDKLQLAGVDPATIARHRKEAHARARRELEALASGAGLSRSAWEARIDDGDPSTRIVEAESELGCDLVVVGKRAQSAAADVLLGSVTRHVLAEGQSDVLITTTAAPTG
jgi:nucleotide-binding universal stress UspA family protein